MNPIRTLIVDDEGPARRRIRQLLQAHPEVEVVAKCRSGREALEAVARHDPELIFLDIQMPEMDGFELLGRLEDFRGPVVIFVTAHDRYALDAFQAAALDYLLKPFDRTRFDRALDRARRQVTLLREEGGADVRALLQRLEKAAGGSRQFISRLAVPSARRIYFVDVGDVDYFRAAGKYVEVVSGGRSHLIRRSMALLQQGLDPEDFLRIHRSTVVNLNRVRELLPYSAAQYVVVLNDGTRLRSGRSFRREIRRLLAD